MNQCRHLYGTLLAESTLPCEVEKLIGQEREQHAGLKERAISISTCNGKSCVMRTDQAVMAFAEGEELRLVANGTEKVTKGLSLIT
jgi:hypothetical protein